MRRFRKSSPSREQDGFEHHRFEHWYRDRTVYFITSRTRGGSLAFKSEKAKAVFWDRFLHYTEEYGFIPWVTSLIGNHYHTIGYLNVGENLGPMMQRIHGSIAKLVNDLLPEKIAPFWWDSGRKAYFDGCIRDEIQARRAYRYTLTQSVRHGLARDYRDYPHTKVNIELERAIKRAKEIRAFMEGIPYKRYEKS